MRQSMPGNASPGGGAASNADTVPSEAKIETPRGPIDGVSFDSRLSLVDNIANLVAKEKQVLIMQLEEKTRQLEAAQQELTTVSRKFHKLETFVSDHNEDSTSAWQRMNRTSTSAKRAALVREWFAGTSSLARGGGPKGPTNRTQSSLSRLVLSYQKVEDSQLATLRRQVPLLPQLTAVDMQCTGLTDESASAALEDFLGPKSGLKELNLADNELGQKALALISRALKTGHQYKTPLRKLDISLNSFAKIPRAGTVIGDAMKTNTTLQELALTLDDISTLPKSRGSSMLGNATQFVHSTFNSSTGCNETLCVLKLTGATLSTKTIEALGRARGAAFRGSLTELDLSSSLIGPSGAFSLVEALESVRPRKMLKLKTLGLRGNGLGDQGAQEVAHLLRGNRSLTSIDLRSNQIGDNGASAIGSALESRVLRKSSKVRSSSPSRMSTRKGHKNQAEKKRKNVTSSEEVAHVLSVIDLGSNPLGVRGGEALLDAARKCVSLQKVGNLSAFVPAGLRQEITRVLAENVNAARKEEIDCGILPYGQACLFQEKREFDMRNSNTKDDFGDDSATIAIEPPAPALHTFPWVITTETKAARVGNILDKQMSTELTVHQERNVIDWTGWHRHYSVYLYRLGPDSWENDVGSECRGFNLEWEGFATCSADPMHRMALEADTKESTPPGKSGSNAFAAMSSAPRNTSLFYRIVRQTSQDDFPFPGVIVKESLIERDDEDGLKFDVSLSEDAAPWQVGDRLQVWVKAAGVSPEENSKIYTRNFALTLPMKKWLGRKNKGGKQDGTNQVLADQTFHQLNLYNGDSPFGLVFD